MDVNDPLGVMVRDTLQEISVLLERHNDSSNALAIALLGDDNRMWDFLDAGIRIESASLLWVCLAFAEGTTVLTTPGLEATLRA